MKKLILATFTTILFYACEKEDKCLTCTRHLITTKYETDSINGGYDIASVDTTVANIVEACSEEDKEKYGKVLEETQQHSWGYYHYKIIPSCQ